MTVDQAMLAKLPDNVHHWFTVNCGVVDPGVTALPIGLRANLPLDDAVGPLSDASLDPQGNDLAFLCAPLDKLWGVYADERSALYNWAHGRSWIKSQHRISPEAFYAGIRTHSYTFCPRGAGPDSHRFWEALYLGSIPIVRHCTAMDHFRAMPVLFVHAWEQVTEELLRRRLPELLSKFDSIEHKLAAQYWKDLIREAVAAASWEEMKA
jgi:hypothetical protein